MTFYSISDAELTDITNNFQPIAAVDRKTQHFPIATSGMAAFQ